MKLSVSEPYRPLYKSSKRNLILQNPRASGKSFEIAQFVAIQKIKYPERDIVVFRANANSLVASVCNEVLEKFEMLGFENDVKMRTLPLRIEYKCGKSFIWFLGISGHDKSRVRGFKPQNPLCLIVGDECQQITEEDNLKHALATFRRYFDTEIDYKTVLCGNPHEVKAHWWNTYCQKYRRAEAYEYITATYKDIAKVLNKDILNEIELELQINPALYRFMYLGDLTDINGGAYPSFRREKHLITPQKADMLFKGEIIETMIIGVDGAIARDATGCTPLGIMTSGRAVAFERFKFDPIKYGRALAPSELVQLISRYLDALDNKYELRRNNVPVYLAVDCASADLIAQLRYELDDYYNVLSFTTKNVIRNTATVNNVFARNACYIIDYGGYFDYAANHFVNTEIPLLVEQLEAVVWKNSKLDPAVPNDYSDSFVYAACTYYENPENLDLPERKNFYAENDKGA